MQADGVPRKEGVAFPMSTWHQDQACHRAYLAGKPIPFWHETKWTVVDDPPNDMRCFVQYPTKKKADDYVASLKKHHPEKKNVYVLPPGKGGRKG